MMNFDYLQQFDIPELQELYKLCHAAEMLQKNDHDMSAIYCRKALECMVRIIYKLKGKTIGERDNLLTLSTSETFTSVLDGDEKLMMATHYIRKVGNIAAHQGGVKGRESYFALLNTYNLVGGILLRLRVLATIAPFDKDLVPKLAQPFATPAAEVPEPSDAIVKLVPAENVEKPLAASVPADELTEQETRRQFIDLLLREAGWDVLERKGVPYAAKAGIEIEVTGMPTPSGKGYCDYVLFGRDGRPLAVVEAKRTMTDAAQGKHQAELYADCLERQYGVRPVIYYTNGFSTHIIDGLGYPPRPVMGFHTLADLELMHAQRGRQPMKRLEIRDDITNRDYQKRAIRAVCDHLNTMHRRALLVMATGTGKTRVAISLCDVMLRQGWIKNVLFLADRTTLVDQACKNFTTHLPQYSICNLSSDAKPDLTARLMFCTYQTMINYIDAETKEFSVGRFDLIVLDEAHRSIFGKYMAIFNYFDSFLVGLTATPREEVDRNTFETFQLDNVPNFEYTQSEAEREGHLVGYNPISRTTRRLREGIRYDTLSEDEREQLDKAWEFEKAKKEMQTGATQEKTPRDIEKSELFDYIFNDKTIDLVLQDLMRTGLKVLEGDKIGKTIIFSYSHEHAQRIVERFYALYPELGSDFCQLVDYSVKHAQDIINTFKVPDKMPQVAVSVDMLDTGIDVPEILNLVFFKPVYSKIKFIQMVGRGTRLCPAVFGPGMDKREFYIFDWCENFEFFNTNPKGREPGRQIAPGVLLLGLELDIAVVLQQATYQQDEFARSFCQRLKDELHAMVASLNVQRIDVRSQWSLVSRYSDAKAWTYISEADADELKQKILPLAPQVKDDNKSRMFDALMLNIMLARLVPHTSARHCIQKVIRLGQRLQRKASIPAVQQRMATIVEISSPKFWEGASLERLEQVRQELRDIIYAAFDSMDATFYISIDDVMEEKPDATKPVFETDYHTRILDFLREHRDHPVLQKITRLEQLTDADIAELERICWHELGTREDYDRYVRQGQMLCGDKVAAFIRSNVGVDRRLAKERFSQFLSDNVLTAEQEEYINQIIDYVCANGDITPETLVHAEAFSDMDWVGVFGADIVLVGRYINELHNLIA